MRLQSKPWYVLILLTALTSGCSEEKVVSETAKEDPKPTEATTNTPSDDAQMRLLAAKDALFMKLSGKLLQTMSEQGPVAAISVCQQEAPQMAKAISEQHRVQIGRIGVRLRNPKNTTPSWATELVAAKRDTPTFIQLADGRDAALFPIKLQATCLMCHGPKEQISADVQAELAKFYPEDQATGFQEGELRGWFWVVAGQ